jgi:hypothetical protein
VSLDLFAQATEDRVRSMPALRASEADAGIFDGFVRGVGLSTMRGFARTGSAIDMMGAVGPIVQDAITGGTTAQDRYFREHDEVWGSAVDHWTPKPNEVGVAGQVVGDVISMLPTVIASPALAVATAQIGTGEELVKKGVDAGRAEAVGAVQGAGLGLGIWMPILGRNLWERVVVGGAAANAVQGIATRGASQVILEGTPAADEFKAFDGQSLTLDVLLGAAFGTLAHLSPAQRAQGEAVWKRIQSWAEDLTPTEKSAIATLREAQHMNVDSAPGRPQAPADVQAHVERVKTAIEQLERGQPVEMADLPEPRFDPEEMRWAQAEKRAQQLETQAERVRKAEGIPEMKTEEPAPAPKESEAPAAKPGGTEPPPPRGSRPGEAAGAEGPDPLRMEAERILAEQPDRSVRVGIAANGEPITKTLKQYHEEAMAESKRLQDEVGLYEVAASCLLGRS